MLINNNKGWSLDLLATLKKPATQYERKINLQKDALALHLVYSRLKEDRGGIQSAEIFIVSAEAGGLGRKCFKLYSIGTWNLQVDYDLSDLVHTKGYCDIVLDFRNRNDYPKKEKERIWLATDRTVFVKSLSLHEYMNLMNHLCEMRNMRIIDRVRVPRENREQWYSADSRDIALSRMINRINAIMNSLMYWGKTEGDFSREIAVNPDRPYRI